MKRYYWALLFFNYFAMGIMVPVLSLALLDKGLDLTSLALIFGLFSLVVLIFEVPSGIMADLIGRKRIFLISNVFYIVSASFLIFTHGLLPMIPVIVFWGAGKAFSSGSMDALIIDSYIELNGAESMPVITSRLALLETAGLSTGAILGGFLPGLTDKLFPFFGTYDFTIFVRSLFIVINTILCAVLIKESRPHGKHVPKLKQHIIESIQFIKGSRIVLLLAIGMFCAGLFLFTVETYWQPSYTALLPAPDWTLGLLSFGCFLFASLGNILIKRLFLKRQKHLHIGYTASRLLLFTILIIFSFQQSAAWFGVMFCLLYFMFGSANTAESTILNIEIPSDKRASLLSISSFVFQAGGLVAPLCAGIAASEAGVRTVWLAVGIAFFTVSAVIGFFLIRINRKKSPAAGECSNSAADVPVTEVHTDPSLP